MAQTKGRSSAKELVDNKISEAKVVIISKSYCPYCKKAKDVFKKLGTDFKVMEIDQLLEMDAIQKYLGKITSGTSVPRVFIDGKFIGGGDDVVSLHKSGKLQKMLQ